MNGRILAALGLTAAAACLSFGAVVPAPEGTALVIKNAGSAVLARNLDAAAGDGYVFINKRGVVKQAFGPPGPVPLRWTSKYGSLTFNQLGREFPWGGLNERGLAIEALAGPAGYPVPDKRPPLGELQWVQYQLDNCRSVKEVLKTDRRVRVSKLLLDVHFLVTEASGKAAVVEFVDGRMVVHTGSRLPVRALAEEGYAASLRRLDAAGDRAARGPAAADRFIRTAAFLQDFLWPVQGILSDHAFSVLRSIERPDTRWSIVYNLPRRLAFFKTRVHRMLKMVRLEAFDLSCAAPVLMLPIETPAGRVVNDDFEPYDPVKNRALLESTMKRLGGRAASPDLPDPGIVRRMAEYPQTCVCSSRSSHRHNELPVRTSAGA